MKCPRDQGALTALGLEGSLGHRCERCSGTLLFEKEFMRSSGHGTAERLAAAAGLASLKNLPEAGCACPRDGKPMRLLRYHGVELDICTACHSVWLDTGEQAKIQAMARRKRVVEGGQKLTDGVGDAAGEVAGDGVLEFVFEAVGSILDGVSL